MTAEILSIGTELLLGDIVDTNAQALGKAFAKAGISHKHRQTVGDNLERMVEAINLAFTRADIVVTIGGLGPTDDDLTRTALSQALDSPLVVDEDVLVRLKQLFEKRGLKWNDLQLRQAMRLECGSPISNPNGTAPGLVCRKDGKVAIAMPGPRNEFVPMLEGPVMDILVEAGGGNVIHSKTLKIVGLGESLVQEKLKDLMDQENPSSAVYAKTFEVHLRITARATTVAEAESQIAKVEEEVRRRIGSHVYGTDEESLAGSVIKLLRNEGASLSVVESCTGGGVGEAITAVSGSSDVFLGGFITYSNDLKVKLADVSEETLRTHGAVSEECAREMAEGGRATLGSTYTLSITGIAGPNSDSTSKPVGLVYVALAGPKGTEVVKNQFIGTREAVRERSCVVALSLLRRTLMTP